MKSKQRHHSFIHTYNHNTSIYPELSILATMKLTINPVFITLLLQSSIDKVSPFSVKHSHSGITSRLYFSPEELAPSIPVTKRKKIYKPTAVTPVDDETVETPSSSVEKKETEVEVAIEDVEDVEEEEIIRTVEITKAEDDRETDFNKLPVIQRLSEAVVTSVKTAEEVNLSTYLLSGENKSLLVFGTYAADFNAIEYVQRLRYYLPQLQDKGVDKIGLILNCESDAAMKLVSMLDLDTDATTDDDDVAVELFIDPNGEAGRKFGVGRGWRPDDEEMSPYVKLFGMLWGLGAWATLPAVIGGYIGNPFFAQPWIEDALAVGQRQGRWPTALDLEDGTGEIEVNKFKELPFVGQWERRPLELATLRLQNMVDISIKNWTDLAPKEDALDAGVLTQLGGVVVVDATTGDEITRWRDPGICAVANFEDLLKKI